MSQCLGESTVQLRCEAMKTDLKATEKRQYMKKYVLAFKKAIIDLVFVNFTKTLLIYTN